MIKRCILNFMLAFSMLVIGQSVYAQGNFSLLVNNRIVRPIDGVYEVKVGDRINIRIDETASTKFPVVQSAVVKAAKIPEEQNEQQQQQQLSTAEEADSLSLPVKYDVGRTNIELDIPDTCSHQIDLEIILTILPQRLPVVKRYRGYSDKFKFFVK